MSPAWHVELDVAKELSAPMIRSLISEQRMLDKDFLQTSYMNFVADRNYHRCKCKSLLSTEPLRTFKTERAFPENSVHKMASATITAPPVALFLANRSQFGTVVCACHRGCHAGDRQNVVFWNRRCAHLSG